MGTKWDQDVNFDIYIISISYGRNARSYSTKKIALVGETHYILHVGKLGHGTDWHFTIPGFRRWGLKETFSSDIHSDIL